MPGPISRPAGVAGEQNIVPDQTSIPPISALAGGRTGRDAGRPIMFLHIPKTAGTSFLLTLENLFGDRHMRRFDLNEPGFEEDFSDLMATPLDGISCVAGHIPMHRLGENAERFRLFTILRNPIERVFSLYRFMRRASPEMKADLGLSEDYSFSEFISSGHPGIFSQTNDGMVRLLAGLPEFVDHGNPLFHRTSEHPELAERALALLEGIDFGLAEDMPGTLGLIARRWDLPFTLDPMMLNTTEHDDVHEDWRNIHALVERNRLDITLYERAREIFRQRLARLDDTTPIPIGGGVLFHPVLGRETPLAEVAGRQGFHSSEDTGLTWIAEGPPAARLHFIPPAGSVSIRLRVFGIGQRYPFERVRLQLHGYPLPFRILERDGAGCVLETRFASTVPGVNTLGIIVPEFVRVRDLNPGSPDPRRLGLAVTGITFNSIV